MIQRWNAATASTAARATEPRVDRRSTSRGHRRAPIGSRCHGTLPDVRILVTGGGGFLGSHLVERLERDGHDVVVARRADYDLTSMDAAARLFDEAEAELVFHLAAEVGGIGANRANPRALLVREPRDGDERPRAGAHPRDAEARDRRDGLLVPEVRAGPLLGGRSLGRVPGGDERAVRRREEGRARGGPGLPRAVRPRRDLPSSPRTCTGRATTSTSRPRT